MICRDLKPSAHARKSANTANKVLGLMARSFHFRDRKTWIGLYKTYVRPHMEYASPCWSPWTNRDIDLLESVQERTVNICSGLRSQTYDDKLKASQTEDFNRIWSKHGRFSTIKTGLTNKSGLPG